MFQASVIKGNAGELASMAESREVRDPPCRMLLLLHRVFTGLVKGC